MAGPKRAAFTLWLLRLHRDLPPPQFYVCSALSFLSLLLLVGMAETDKTTPPVAQGSEGGAASHEMVYDRPYTPYTVEALELAVASAYAPAPSAPALEAAAVPPLPPVAAVEAQPLPEAPAPSAPAVQPVILAPPPAVGARAYAVVERACGTLLWGQNENDRLPPASITKIITALVVMDSAGLDDVAESHVSGSAMKARGSSVMGVEPGMRLSVKDLLYGLMLKSGNDAALVLADHVGHGNRDAFVEAMNAKAASLGMTNTHFTNPHGLDSDEHYSSPADMARAGAALLEQPFLADMSDQPDYRPDWDGATLRNGNKLLGRYPGAYGVKIGYTRGAKQTIVAAAERDGRHLIVSIFGSEDRYTDAEKLFDWAFANTQGGCG